MALLEGGDFIFEADEMNSLNLFVTVIMGRDGFLLFLGKDFYSLVCLLTCMDFIFMTSNLLACISCCSFICF